MLEDADYIFTLEPVLPGETTAEEEEALAALEAMTAPCRASVRVDGEFAELSGIELLSGILWERLETLSEDTQLLVFCEETGDTALLPMQTALIAEETWENETLWNLQVALIPQMEAKGLTFAPVYPIPTRE